MKELGSIASQTLLCKVLDVPRSTVRYESKSEPVRPALNLIDLILEARTKFSTFGVRHMYYHLRRVFTRREIRAAYAELGLLRPVLKKRIRTTDSNHEHPRYKNLVKTMHIHCINQVWVADVTFIWTGHRFVYLAHIMDAYSRKIVGWAMSLSNDTALTLRAFEAATVYGVPQVHHSDQGANYASNAYTGFLVQHGVAISMAAAGCPHENGLSERWNRTLKEEEVYRSGYENFAQAFEGVASFVKLYNEERIHSSISYRTPDSFWREAQAVA